MKIISVEAMILRKKMDKPFTSARGWWYKTKNAMLVSTDLNMAGYTGEQVAAMQRRMIERLSAIPGVKAVGASTKARKMIPPTQTTSDSNIRKRRNDMRRL